MKLQEISTLTGVPLSTLKRHKKSNPTKFQELVKQAYKNDVIVTRLLKEKWGVELLGNYGIWWSDYKDYSVGVLAEDTNALLSLESKSKETLEEIEKNLALLKSWLE